MHFLLCKDILKMVLMIFVKDPVVEGNLDVEESKNGLIRPYSILVSTEPEVIFHISSEYLFEAINKSSEVFQLNDLLLIFVWFRSRRFKLSFYLLSLSLETLD